MIFQMLFDGGVRLKIKKMKKTLPIAVLVILAFGIIPGTILTVEATPWVNWKSGAVGDIAENWLPDYWTITSTPYSGYSSYIWSDWEDVVDSGYGVDHNGNFDTEILFTTYSSFTFMGSLMFESKMEIEDAKIIQMRGLVGCRFTYSGVRTVGSVQLFDVTTQTSLFTFPIVTSSIANQFIWIPYASLPTPVSTSHDYVIRLIVKDAWISQKVEVRFESAEVWSHAPYFASLTKWSDTGNETKWNSYFGFKTGEIDDMKRDHRPYVLGDVLTAWGWDPCYIHEFRSEPYWILDYNEYYLTNLPGIVGDTESTDAEEIADGYEEVEVFTRSVESLLANVLYYVRVGYYIEGSGTVTMTLEAELGNEADIVAILDPPARPVAYLDLKEVDANYGSPQLLFLANDIPVLEENNLSVYSSPIYYYEQNDYFEVIVVGDYPNNLKVYTRVNVENQLSLSEYIENQRFSNLDKSGDLVAAYTEIPVTITFNSALSVEDTLSLIDFYDLNVQKFRYSAWDGHTRLQGQGVPYEGEIIPFDIIEGYLEDSEFLGIHSLIVLVNPSIVDTLMNDKKVAVVDISAAIALFNTGLDISGFGEIHWYLEDVTWYLNYAFTSQ